MSNFRAVRGSLGRIDRRFGSLGAVEKCVEGRFEPGGSIVSAGLNFATDACDPRCACARRHDEDRLRRIRPFYRADPRPHRRKDSACLQPARFRRPTLVAGGVPEFEPRLPQRKRRFPHGATPRRCGARVFSRGSATYWSSTGRSSRQSSARSTARGSSTRSARGSAGSKWSNSPPARRPSALRAPE